MWPVLASRHRKTKRCTVAARLERQIERKTHQLNFTVLCWHQTWWGENTSLPDRCSCNSLTWCFSLSLLSHRCCKLWLMRFDTRGLCRALSNLRSVRMRSALVAGESLVGAASVIMVFQITPGHMCLYLTEHDGILCNAIWGLKGTHIQQVYCLTQHRLRFMNLVTMEDDERHECFAILHWEMWFFYCLTILSRYLAQSDEPWPIFAYKDWEALLHPNMMMPSIISNSPAHCELF